MKLNGSLNNNIFIKLYYLRIIMNQKLMNLFMNKLKKNDY